MTKGEIEISGKTLLSLKRASRVSGYAKDYIGQLCRAGKITSKKRIGRDWFVDIDEIISYKKRAEQIKKQNGLNAVNEFPLQKKEISPSPSPASTLKIKEIKKILSPAIAVLILAAAFVVYAGGLTTVPEIFQRAVTSSNVLAQDLRSALASAGKIPGKIFIYAGDKNWSNMSLPAISFFGFLDSGTEVINSAAKDVADGIINFPQNFKELAQELLGTEVSNFTAVITPSVFLPTPSVESMPKSEELTPTPSPLAIQSPVVQKTVVEKTIIEKIVSGLTKEELDEKLQALNSKLMSEVLGLKNQLSYRTDNVYNATIASNYQAVALTNKIDNLSGVTINNSSITGTLNGLTDAHIPDSITASNYLPLSGGILTGSLAGTDLTLSGNLTVSGSQTLSGAITIPYLTATSTTATSTFPYLTVSNNSNLGTIVGGTWQGSTIGVSYGGTGLSTGGLASTFIPFGNGTSAFATSTNLYFSGSQLTANYASTTAISVSGNAYFPGSGIWNSSGNVGIGTASPIYLLDVNGTGRFTSQVTLRDLVLTGGSSYPIISNNPIFIRTDENNNDAAGTVEFQVSDGGGMVFLSALKGSGNVGIGTASPSTKLEVSGNGDVASAIRIFNTNANSYAYLEVATPTMTGLFYGFGNTYTTSGRYIQSSFLLDTNGLGGLSLAAVHTSGVIRFYTNGNNERMRIDASGNVGIGQISPSALLDLVGNGLTLEGNATLDDATGNEVAYQLNYTTNKASSGNDTGLLINQTDTASPGTSNLLELQKDGVQKVRIENTGDIIWQSIMRANSGFISNNGLSTYVETTLPLQTMAFTTSDNAIEMASGNFSGAGVTQTAVVIKPTWNQTTTSAATDLLINRTQTAVGSGLQFLQDWQVGGVSKAVLTNTGYFGLGTTTPNYALSVQGTAQFPSLVNDSTGYYACVNASTGQLATSTGICGASSLRFKENIEDLSYGLAEITQLNPVFFTWKESYLPSEKNKKQVGLIAEEVAEILPELVARDNEDSAINVDYPKLTAVLIKAVQELNEKIANSSQYVSSQITSGFDGLLDWLSDKVVAVKQILVDDKICIGNTCVNEEQLKQLLENNEVPAGGEVPPEESTSPISPIGPIEDVEESPSLEPSPPLESFDEDLTGQAEIPIE